MSNAIRYDPLLVHYLAEELDGLLRGRACASAPYFAAGRVALLPLDRGEALELDLHPRRGWIRIIPWASEAGEMDAFCRSVESHRDERRLTFHIDAPDRFRSGDRRIEVELQTNQWNVLLVSGRDERIHAALWARRAGERMLHPGAEYRAPEAVHRVGAEAVAREEARRIWVERIGGVAPSERQGALLRSFAWTGTVNAVAILGRAGEEEAGGADDPESADRIELAFDRWWTLRSLPPANPALLTAGPHRQPYPLPLDGWHRTPTVSLLAAMERAAGEDAPAASGQDANRMAAVRRRWEAAERRIRRIEEERAKESGADELRMRADLLLARLHEVPKGAVEVHLTGWEGSPIRMELDPALSVAGNASAWYAEARRKDRAAERLPALLEAARADAERWRAALEGGERGELPEWVERALAVGGGSGTEGSESLPYRVFRSSGGLEIRVGRNAKANDRLTFGHSSPNDIWMHARQVPGSHVILRWREPEGSPPGRDLEEAARLAAFHSRARTSAIVAVDWTRRKYVRKPRGAPPGSVVTQRVRTLFVEPDDRTEQT